MEILLADEMGFCMGVRRAIDLLDAALSEDRERPPHMFGPLIHNPRLIDSYRKLGVHVVKETNELGPGDRVLIRAHGISAAVRREIEATGAEIIDATCPKVAASMQRAARAEAEGRTVYLVGDPGHGEMEAVAGALSDPGGAIILPGPEAAERVAPVARATLIAQTTYESEGYEAVIAVLETKVDDLQVYRSICPATRKRQEAVRRLATSCDALIVVGGRNSANTQRLFEIAGVGGRPVWQVEGVDDLPSGLDSYQRIGISAGASTPDAAVAEVVDYLQTLGEGV